MASLILLFACARIHTISATIYDDHITALNSNAYLYSGDQIWSMDQTTKLNFQSDGNFVLYLDGAAQSIWRSITNPLAAGGYVELRNETGNLVIRDADDNWHWDTSTNNMNRQNNGYHLVVITQCAFLIYEDINGQLHSLWNSQNDTKNRNSDCSKIDSYSFPTVDPTHG